MLGIGTCFNNALPSFDEQRLFFDVVVLKAQGFAFFYKQNLSDVVLSSRPEDFIAPRFFDFCRGRGGIILRVRIF